MQKMILGGVDPRRDRGSAIRPGRAMLALALLGAALLTMACETQVRPPPIRPDSATYVVGPPDELFVTILPDPVVERPAIVRPDGRISIDLIGDVQAAGRTVEDISREIEERYGRYKRDARATVAVVNSLSQAITIVGEVRQPGTFPLLQDTRVSAAIGSRGGTSIFASKSRIRLIRTNGEATEVFIIDLEGIEEGDLSSNMMMRGGDMVVVPPNVLARVGYGLQTVLFPFQQIFSATAGVAASARIF